MKVKITILMKPVLMVSVILFFVFQMRKQRTLTDLLEEAEGASSDPFRHKKQQVRYDA